MTNEPIERYQVMPADGHSRYFVQVGDMMALEVVLTFHAHDREKAGKAAALLNAAYNEGLAHGQRDARPGGKRELSDC